jgi:DNA polymerase-3 subunit epsilon
VFGRQDRRRTRQIDALDDGPLKRFYDNPSSSANDRSASWRDARYLVLDLETTGLDPSRDHMLSAGWICVEGGDIVASTARHHLIKPPAGIDVGPSATIHGITDADAADGDDVAVVVEALLADLEGRVLVCHFAQIELGFVGRTCRSLWGADLWPRHLIDTMQWHHDRAHRLGLPIRPDDLRLYSLLERYGLPATRPHHALSDAYGTALLLVATAANLSPRPSDGTVADDGTLGALLDGRSW